MIFPSWTGRVNAAAMRVRAGRSGSVGLSLGGDVLLICGACAMLWVGIGLLLSQKRSDALRGAAHDTQNLARAFEENTARMVDAVDRALLLLRSAYLADPDRFDLRAWQRELQLTDDVILQTSIIGPDGRLRMSSLQPVPVGLDLSDREHFRVQLDPARDALFVSKPLLGRRSGKWSLQLTRKIIGRDGQFAGVAVITVDPLRLASFYETMAISHARIMLVGLDGVVRAAAPAGADMLGRDIGGSPLLARARQEPKGTLDIEEPDGGTARVSYRRFDLCRMIVAVSLDRRQVLASYWQSRIEYVIGGGIVSGLILAVGSSVLFRRRVLLRTQAELVHSKRMLTETLENMSQGIFMVDRDRRFAVVNRRATELLGLPEGLVAQGASFDALLRWQLDNGEFGADESVRRLAESGGLEFTDSVYERARPNGTVLEVRTRRLGDDRAVRTFTDITERKRAEARISYLAHHDGLTGLANRSRFQDELARAIEQSRRAGRGFAVLGLDLDRFKQVNDAYGHHVGDDLLRAVAARIGTCLREGDTVARFGGDEFAVLQSDVGEPTMAGALAERLVACLTEPYNLDGVQLVIGASIGVALYPADGQTGEHLLKSSDTALYKAKRDGRGRSCFFEAAMDVALQERYALERDLREAPLLDQIGVNFQPICDAVLGRPIAFEALARWTHPTRGAVPPHIFVPLAEETGQIERLGLLVLHAACREAATWPAPLRLTVNLSPLQFLEPQLDRQILRILEQTGLEPSRLGLEVTEGALIRNGEEALATMHALRRWGVRIYLDDFGTGHAGLSYLLRFPFDCIKIDRSFIRRLNSDAGAEAVIRAVMLLGEGLRLDVVAEGIETEMQRTHLVQLGCTQIQGYLFGQPRTPAETLAYIGEHTVEHVPLCA